MPRAWQVEMHAVPCRPVRDLVPGVSLEAGEKLLVEISRKFTPASIAALAEEAGLVLQVPRGRGLEVLGVFGGRGVVAEAGEPALHTAGIAGSVPALR